MSDVSRIGVFGSNVTESILSSREKQFFKRVFESGQSGRDTLNSQTTESVARRPHVGTKLNMKV